jgi:hypothetical protein
MDMPAPALAYAGQTALSQQLVHVRKFVLLAMSLL